MPRALAWHSFVFFPGTYGMLVGACNPTDIPDSRLCIGTDGRQRSAAPRRCRTAPGLAVVQAASPISGPSRCHARSRDHPRLGAAAAIARRGRSAAAASTRPSGSPGRRGTGHGHQHAVHAGDPAGAEPAQGILDLSVILTVGGGGGDGGSGGGYPVVVSWDVFLTWA